MATEKTPQQLAVIKKIDDLKLSMQDDFVQSQLKAVLAENSSAFAASVIDLYTSEKTLMDCDPKHVIMQCMKAAVLKLPINKSLGFAYIVAYAGVPQFQIGYKGLVQLAMRTGQYRIINADVVYNGEYRTSNKLTGEFDLTGEKKSDEVIGYFAYLELLNGFSKTLFMSKERVEKHGAKYSKSYNQTSGPWKKEFDAMAIKTVLKNLIAKYGVMSVDMANSIETDTNEDAADRVMDEIRGNANLKPMGFENVQEAEMAETNNSQPSQQANQNSNGQIPF